MSNLKHQCIKELKKIAKEQGVKLKSNATRTAIRLALGLEEDEIPTRFNHCKKKKIAQLIIRTNVETGEEKKYSSIFQAANDNGKFAGSITYRIKIGKTLKNNDDVFTFRKE